MIWPLCGPSGAVAVVTACLIDRWWGEPPARWHPVVWIGRALSSVGAPWPEATPPVQFARGIISRGLRIAQRAAWSAVVVAALVQLA